MSGILLLIPGYIGSSPDSFVAFDRNKRLKRRLLGSPQRRNGLRRVGLGRVSFLEALGIWDLLPCRSTFPVQVWVEANEVVPLLLLVRPFLIPYFTVFAFTNQCNRLNSIQENSNGMLLSRAHFSKASQTHSVHPLNLPTNLVLSNPLPPTPALESLLELGRSQLLPRNGFRQSSPRSEKRDWNIILKRDGTRTAKGREG